MLPPETRVSADGALALDLSVAGTLRARRAVGHTDPARRHRSLWRSAGGDGCGAHRHSRSHAGHAADVRRGVADRTTLGPGAAASATAAGENRTRRAMAVAVAFDASGRASPSFIDCARHEHHPGHPSTLSSTPDTIREIGGKDGRSRSPPRRMLSRSNACVDRQCSTKRSSRWPAFHSNRWFPRDCGFRAVTHGSRICTGIRSATPSARPGEHDITAECPRSMWPSTGGLDLRLLGAFATGIATGGTAQADFTVSGPLRSPSVVGRIGVTNGELRLDTPRLVASELEGRCASTRAAPRPSAWPAR